LTKTPEGPVTYNTTICMGCRYCMLACPYEIPRYDWDEAVPYVRKCVLCYDQITSGELSQPACTAACPTEATIYGSREALLEEAHRRIEAEPNRYIPKVWGEHEVGGSSVLYLSDIDLSFLGIRPDMGTEPLPLTTVPAMTAVPPVFLGVGAVMAGTYWIIERRIRLQREREAKAAATAADLAASDGEAPAGEDEV
jgi:formate dehydrogenase iron-sulfur subunit